MKPLLRNKTAGFTLLEIMLVIIIIVALMTALIPSLMNAMNDSRKGTADIYVNKLKGDISLYEMSNGAPPSTAQGLKALVEMPQGEPRPRKWSQREEKLELDPWGMDYRYEFPGKHNPKSFDVYSCGPDRQPNTPDDVGNWQQ